MLDKKKNLQTLQRILGETFKNHNESLGNQQRPLTILKRCPPPSRIVKESLDIFHITKSTQLHEMNIELNH